MSQGPSAGAVLLAIFLILFGLCFTLLGGGCAIFWLWAMLQTGSSMNGSGGFLMVGLVTLAVGVLLLWVSVKLLRGNPAGAVPPAPRDNSAQNRYRLADRALTCGPIRSGRHLSRRIEAAHDHRTQRPPSRRPHLPRPLVAAGVR